MTAKEYQGGAVATTLVGGISDTATSFVLTVATGWPSGSTYPFVVCLERGTASEEKILCASRSGTTVTVTTRGYDGTTGKTHSAGATAEHVLDAATLSDLRDHTHALSYGTPVAVGVANAAGSATTVPRSDHVHQSSAAASFGSPVAVGTANADGSSSSVPHADHVHATQARIGTQCTRGSVSSIAQNTFTDLTWTTEVYDSNGFITAPSTTFTVPSGMAGVYGCAAEGLWAVQIAGISAIDIHHTSSGVGTDYQGMGSGTDTMTTAAIIYLAVGDTLSVNIIHSDASAHTLTSASFRMYRLTS